MRRRNRVDGWAIVIIGLFGCWGSPAFGFQSEASNELDAKTILKDQTRIANQYKLLEEKLFALYQYERDNNPMRSKLLERAYGQSKQQMTAAQLQQIVRLLADDRLKDAEQNQEIVLSQLTQLLTLLESEDRSKRVQDEIRRHQEYLKEVERLLRIQKSIRGQTEANGDSGRLANSEARAIDRAKKLAEEIERNEAKSAGRSGGEDDSESQSPSAEPNDNNKKEADRESDSKNGEKESKQPKGEGGQDDNQEGQPDIGSEQDSKQGEGSKGNIGKPQDGGQPGQPNSGKSDPNSPAPDDSPQDSVRKRIRAAEQRMRKAQQKLEDANKGESVEEMRAAEIEIAKAKLELEEILRQLREEEIERMLAGLETRFRKMLEQQVRIADSTTKMDEIPDSERGTDFEIRSGKLGKDQQAISIDAERALLLLTEDGSSVAFPKTVEQMQQDMVQVSKRLAGAKTGKVTQGIQLDVVETLKFLIESLVVTQKDMERMKRKGQKPGQAGQPGEQALVNSLAELKMLRGLQKRIYQRHERYARLLDDPDDPKGITDDPDIQAALERLSMQQEDLSKITRDIVNGLTK